MQLSSSTFELFKIFIEILIPKAEHNNFILVDVFINYRLNERKLMHTGQMIQR